MADLELRAERMAAGGDAIAREPSGRVVFVDGALPGELVRVRVTQHKRDYARAATVDVLEPSGARVRPPCPYVAGGCGGCRWQHVDASAQRSLKVGIVTEALVRTGGLAEPAVVLGPALAPWGFRTTLRLAVDRSGRAAFRAARSHDHVVVDHCSVAHPRLTSLLAESRFPGAQEVTLRCSATTGDRLALVDPVSATDRAVVPADVALGPGTRLVERVAGATLQVSARSFFQTRHDGAAALVAVVRDLLAGQATTGVLVDAYAGVGLFGVTVGQDRDVIAIEQSPSSCSDARLNLPRAQVVEDTVERWHPVPADTIVADPARRGLDRRAVDVLAATGASRLVLVSCDPVSLARDAHLLSAAGYRHDTSVVVDLFPHTPHVEVVTSFDRG
jgi:23S rRNA (uracil1939-C5)-methyltransferase